MLGWSINKAGAKLEEGFRFRVGAGDVSIWYDQWGPNDIAGGRVGQINIHDFSLTLKEHGSGNEFLRLSQWS